MRNIVIAINSLSDILSLKPATAIQIAVADGLELTGITKSEYRNVVSLTKKEWELNPKVPHTMYVVENTCIDEIIIWQDTSGLIYQSSPNTEPQNIANSLAEYITNRT